MIGYKEHKKNRGCDRAGQKGTWCRTFSSIMRERETTRSNDDGQCLVYEPLKIQERTASPIRPSSSSSSPRLRCRCCPRTSSPRARATLSFVTIMWSNDRHYGMRDQSSALSFFPSLSVPQDTRLARDRRRFPLSARKENQIVIVERDSFRSRHEEEEKAEERTLVGFGFLPK